MASQSQIGFFQQPETIFYDGNCGLCSRAVRFVAARDRSASFQFAPLHGSTFISELSASQRNSLPDTMAVLTRSGSLLIRSDALAYILRQLGRRWAIAAALLVLVPRWLRDHVYDWAASVRHRLFKLREDQCPVMPAALRARFRP